MLKPHIITGLLAVFFVIAGCLLVHAYTRYSIGTEKLALLKGQEHFLSSRIAELNRKNKILVQMDQFVKTAEQLGLYKENWNRFTVGLTREPLMFSEFMEIIDQTAHCPHYYFRPERLNVRQMDESDREKPPDNDLRDADSKNTAQADLVVDLQGYFLIRNE